MTKRKIWIAGNIVLIFLLTCTVLSLRVEKLMRMEVKIVEPIQTEEEQFAGEARIPLSCYQGDESQSAIFYVEEREGLFGKEMVAVEQLNWPLREEGNLAVVQSSQMRNQRDGWLKIVEQSSYPLEDGDLVEIGITEKPHEKMLGQMKILACLIAIIPLSVLILEKSVKMLGVLLDGEKKQTIEGVVLVIVWFGVIYYLTGMVDIPRKFLPPEQILDIGFYVKHIYIREYYKEEWIRCGIGVVCAWGVTVAGWRLRVHHVGKE